MGTTRDCKRSTVCFFFDKKNLPPKMPISVKVKLLKEMYHIDIDPDAPVMDFRKAIEEQTFVAPSSQRIKLKGKIIPADQEAWEGHFKDHLVDGALFMIMQ